MPIRHAYQSATADDPGEEVSSGEWNANHVLSSFILSIVTASPAANQDDYSPTGWDDAEPAKATELRLTPTASIKLTGLAGGVDGRMAVVVNDSSDRLVILEDESVSSTAANRFAMRNPVFLVPGGSVTLRYDGVSSRWRVVATSGGIGFGAFFDLYEDFLGTIGAFGSAVNGTGASVQIGTYLANATERPMGIWQGDTGTTAAGRAHIGAAQNNSVIPGQGQVIFLARLAVEALSTGTERFQIFAGLHDAVGGTNVTDGVYWCYRDDASAAWQGSTAAASTRNETGQAGPTVDTNYIWLGIFVDPSWARATFFYSVDSATWVIAGEKTANIPNSSQVTGMGVTINKTIGTTQRNVSVDMIGMRYDIQRG